MTVSCSRFRVTGRVQGVFFRASTARQARKLGLTGFARNRQDGSVEVLVCGRPDAIDTLGQWLWQGSPASAVADVVRADLSEEQTAQSGGPPNSFTTR